MDAAKAAPINKGRLYIYPFLAWSKEMQESTKVKGPASYFPSIEKRYGFPIQHWLNLLSASDNVKHMEMVAWLKSEYNFGHGHANALVAYFRQMENL